MRTTGAFLAVLIFATSGTVSSVAAQEAPLPPSDRAPVLVLAHPAAHAPVTSLAFAPDASVLYAAGFDKQIRRYELAKGKYAPAGAFRVPIAPGNAGVLNAVAVSPDGKWIAAAGRAPIRGEAWSGSDDGIGENHLHLAPLMKRDTGVVYLFDPKNPQGGRVIRGAQSEVRAVAFANPAPARGPVVITAGIEWNQKGEFFGVVRVFDATTGAEIDSRRDLPTTPIPPGIAAWAVGPDKKGLRVAVAWDNGDLKAGGKLLLWDDPGTKQAKSEWLPERAFNSALAVRTGKDGAATELITGGFELPRGPGGLTVRPTEGNGSVSVSLAAPAGRILLPAAVAALNVEGVGAATAVVVRIAPAPGTTEWLHELRLLRAGAATQTVALAGVSTKGSPVLAASPDGRFVAVAGFADNRVEVYDATSLATGKPQVEKLAGEASRFSKTAFLVGEKLWLGGPNDTPTKGGIVLDLDRAARVAAPPAGKDELKLDAPLGATTVKLVAPDARNKVLGSVSVTVAGKEYTTTLPEGEVPTAAAFLPEKPAWDPALGPVVAVAHLHDQSKTVLVTLFNATDGKTLVRLGGPTLPIRSLAFSGSRALLAAAGDDGTVAVWSLRKLTQPLSAIKGVIVASRGGEVVVASVEPGHAVAEKFTPDDVIEAVGGEKGDLKPIKTTLDFTLAVRAIKPGDNARVKVKDKAAPVVVPVGTATGFRHPLFTLWVDPVAREGKHDWIGWTAAGPYDTNGETAETRIGWLTATGDPARPVTFAGAGMYRKLYYKRDFLRLLVEKADYNEAISQIPPPRKPTLTTTLKAATESRDGKLITREKADGLDVSLSDPDNVLDLDPAVLRWRTVAPDGTAGAWQQVPFAAGRVAVDLSKHSWNRGEHRFQVRLYKSGAAPPDATPEDETTVSVAYVPPAPVLTVLIDGKPLAPGAAITTETPQVTVGVAVDGKANAEGVAVALSWTGAGDSVRFRENPPGTFAPEPVKLKPSDTTAIRVTATNRGDGVKPDMESHTVEVSVRHVPPKMVPPPGVKLLVVTPYDFRTATDEPYVVSTPKVTVTATVRDANPIAQYEWKIGDADWTEAKYDPKAPAETRELPLDPEGKPLVVQVRAKSKQSGFATDAVRVIFDGLPEVSVSPLATTVVTSPELYLAGGLKVTGKRKFNVRVLVTSSRTGRTREVEPTPDDKLTRWEAGVTLFPGENQLGYVIRYDDNRKELRKAGLMEVRYVRPPVVAAAPPIEAGTGAVGDVHLAVLASPDAAPSEMWVDGTRVGFRSHTQPVSLFGTALWLIRAEGVPVKAGNQRLKSVTVVVRNAERESRPVNVEVRGKAPTPVPPPAIGLSFNGSPISSERPVGPLSESRFAFDLRVNSEKRLTRVEVWHGAGGDTAMQPVGGVDASAAVGAPGGFELSAKPALRLRPGVNRVRVIASSADEIAQVQFTVSYTPPAVRVVIDSIKEPDGKPISFLPGSAGGAEVTGSIIDVEGRVVWDLEDEPVARDPNLSVVFIANGVAHLPVTVAPARGAKERKFAGRVYLNALDDKAPGLTRIRVDLRSGGRTVPIPQQGVGPTEFPVTSKNPLRRQRLHVLMIGVEVPEARRRDLVREVVEAVGGKIPKGSLAFAEGAFERPGFEFAYLYTPRLGYTKGGDLNTLLNSVRTDIERRARRPGEEWVNDVIVVYYQGGDWVEDGRWLLHSATTMSGAAGKNPAEYAIRLDNLPQVPGMPVAVVNVASRAQPGASLAIDLPFLRCSWQNSTATNQLLPYLRIAVEQERTMSGVARAVEAGVSQNPAQLFGKPTTALPPEVGSRVVGLGNR